MAPNLASLFARCETDLQKLLPNFNRGFVCPICLKLFDRKANLADELAIEHIVPKALGGKLTTLTCRRCNNNAGAKLESHLVQRVQIGGGKKPILASVDFCGAHFRGEVHLPKSAAEALKIYGVRKQSHFREIEKFSKLLSNEEWDGQQLNLNLELQYVQAFAFAALLRSAYLLMFRLFGYRYVFDKSASVIRNTIAEPLVETSALNGITWQVSTHGPSDTGVSVVTKPSGLRSFMVFLTLDKGQDLVSAIALPPPGAGTEFFRLITEAESPRRCLMSHWLPGDHDRIMPFDKVWKYVIGLDSLENGKNEDSSD